MLLSLSQNFPAFFPIVYSFISFIFLLFISLFVSFLCFICVCALCKLRILNVYVLVWGVGLAADGCLTYRRIPTPTVLPAEEIFAAGRTPVKFAMSGMMYSGLYMNPEGYIRRNPNKVSRFI